MDLGITPGHPLAFDCRTPGKHPARTSKQEFPSIRSWPRPFVGEPDSIHLNLAVKEAWEPADVTLATPVCIRATSLVCVRPALSQRIEPSPCTTDCLPPLVPPGQTCSSRAVWIPPERAGLCPGRRPSTGEEAWVGDRDRLDEYFEGLRGVERQLEYLDQRSWRPPTSLLIVPKCTRELP